MAPKGVKRTAGSPAGGARKKTNADPVAPKCREVIAALNKADLSGTCQEFLTESVQTCLTVLAADRHRFQQQAVGMVSETLDALQTAMKNTVAQAQGTVDSADREKAARSAALESAQATLASLEQQNTAAEATTEHDKITLHNAKANVASAQAAVEGKDGELASMSEQKAKLETALKEVYEPIKTSKASAKALHTLEKIFTDVGVEAGLVAKMPETFKKDPEARGSFDGVVMKSVEDQTSQYIAQTQRALDDGEHSKATLATAKAAADAALSAADEKLTASSAALQAAKAALKDGKDSLKTAHGAVASFEREMATAATDLEHAKTSLTSMQEGALQSFAALKDLATPALPEFELAEPPAAEAAAEVAVGAVVAAA